MPRWRPLTRMIVVGDALFGVLMVVAVVNVLTSSCGGQIDCTTYIDRQMVGFTLVLFMAALINVIMAIVWAVTRKPPSQHFAIDGASRKCPHCWEPMHARATVCIRCHRESEVPIADRRPSFRARLQEPLAPRAERTPIPTERVSPLASSAATSIDDPMWSFLPQRVSKGGGSEVDTPAEKLSRTEGEG